MIATQTSPAPRTGDSSAEFAPLLFKKSASGSAASSPADTSSQGAAPVRTDITIARNAISAQTGTSQGGYVRPGTNLDIKV